MSAPPLYGKAARDVAAGLREKSAAEAEQVRANGALERRARALSLEDDQARRAEERKAARRAAKLKLKADRRQARVKASAARWIRSRRGVAAAAAGVRDAVPYLLGVIAMGAPIVIAWRGQSEYGEHQLGLGGWSWVLPVALEGAAWYQAFLAHRAITHGLPSLRYRMATWLLAGAAAVMNLWHGAESGSLSRGVVLALCSLLGVLQWELTAMQNAQVAGGRSIAELRIQLWRWIRYPRLHWAAHSTRTALGPACSTEQAWHLAWRDRYGVGPTSTRAERTVAAAVLARQVAEDLELAADGELLLGADGRLVRPKRLAPESIRMAELQDLVGENAVASITDWLADRFPAQAYATRGGVGSGSSSLVPLPRPAAPPAGGRQGAGVGAGRVNGGQVNGHPKPTLTGRPSPTPDAHPKPTPATRPSPTPKTRPRARSVRLKGGHPIVRRRTFEQVEADFYAAIRAGRLDPSHLTADGIKAVVGTKREIAVRLRDEYPNPAHTHPSGEPS
ncbi:DUF2637 domain-containing protein [Nonomuraea sp. NPDC050394]|uniref:DUF2637 domain-containing protein n=1 Tax=Nonomuraea sp. NPDC050394 TaxID=3364363 RepID=UPI00379B7116